jgi:hypothetical protein
MECWDVPDPRTGFGFLHPNQDIGKIYCVPSECQCIAVRSHSRFENQDNKDPNVGLSAKNIERDKAALQKSMDDMLKARQNLALCRSQLFSGSRSWRRE